MKKILAVAIIASLYSCSLTINVVDKKPVETIKGTERLTIGNIRTCDTIKPFPKFWNTCNVMGCTVYHQPFNNLDVGAIKVDTSIRFMPFITNK